MTPASSMTRASERQMMRDWVGGLGRRPHLCMGDSGSWVKGEVGADEWLWAHSITM